MKLVGRLLRYFRPYWGLMAIAVIALTVGGGLLSLGVAALKPMVNEVLRIAPAAGVPTPASGGGPDFLETLRRMLPAREWRDWWLDRVMILVPLVLVLVSALRGVCIYIGAYLAAKVGAQVIRDLRAALHQSITVQAPSFFEAHATGSLLSRMVSDVQRLQRVSTEVVVDAIRLGSGIPFLVVLVVLHDWRLSLITPVALVVGGYPMVRLSRRLRKASRHSQQGMGDLSNQLSETVLGIRVVQSFGMERRRASSFGAVLDTVLRADLKAGRASALTQPVLELVGSAIGAALFAYAGLFIARGQLNPGDFTVAVGGLALLFVSLRRLIRVNVELQSAMAGAERVFEILDCEPEIRDRPGAITLAGFERGIRFEGVDFGYQDRDVLRGLDLEVAKGEMVALVGPSGSGKTTIANMIPRFYDPAVGRVAIDGHDLRDLTLKSLRSQIAVVTQDTVLFDASVYDNITGGRDDVPMERVESAARAAHAHEFIVALPEGYETRLGERGTRLSMGQRQRLAIARALLKDPPILILDEATAALDAESEHRVQEALETLLVGRTSVVIAHRLATVRRATRTVVLDHGRLVEQGTHDELVDNGGLYARLYQLQFRDVEPSAG